MTTKDEILADANDKTVRSGYTARHLRKPWNEKDGVYERDASGHHHYAADTFRGSPRDVSGLATGCTPQEQNDIRKKGLQAPAKEV